MSALLTSSLSLGLLYSASAPRLLVLLAALNLIQLVLFLGITLRWKISAHCTAVASLAVLGFYLLGLISSWLLAVVPVVAWARIYLGIPSENKNYDRHRITSSSAHPFVSHTFPPEDRPLSSVGGMQRVAVDLHKTLEGRDDIQIDTCVLRSSWRWAYVFRFS